MEEKKKENQEQQEQEQEQRPENQKGALPNEKEVPKEKPAENKEEEPKPEEPKKPEQKAEEPKKEEPKKEAAAKQEEPKGGVKKRIKINKMTLDQVEKKLAEAKEKMGSFMSKYARELLKRKKDLTGE